MKAAVIGLGPMGQRHIQALRELEINLCGVCDKDSQKVEETAIKWQIKDGDFFYEPIKLIEEKKPDFVIVATNSNSHTELVALSAKYAKFILCEKPMADSVQSCQKIIKICEEKGVQIAINHPQRYSESVKFLRDTVNDKNFGGIENITCICANVGLAMIGSHLIEMSRIIMGDTIVSVSALLEESKYDNPRGKNFLDPVGSIVGITESGKKMVMNIGNESGLGLKIIISCKYGMIEGDLLKNFFLLNFRKEECRNLPPIRYGCQSETETVNFPQTNVVELTKRVINGLLKGDDLIKGSAEDAMYVVKVLTAAYQSSESLGRLVEIKNANFDRKFPWP